MNYYILISLISGLAALASVRWVYFRILKIAKQKQLVDNPDARKLQKTPVPVMGGIAVFFGVLCGVLVACCLYALPQEMGVEALPAPSSNLLPILIAMALMLYTGAIDDIVGLSAGKRLLIEALVVLGLVVASGGCVDTFRGMWGIGELRWWIAVPLTVFAGVGIINAINMIDGINGLSSGLCMTCSLLFAAAFTRILDWQNAFLAYSMTGALLCFFIHNVFGRRSRMFIGDAGTMMMGILMTWFVISTLRAPAMTEYYTPVMRTNMVAMCLAILAVPIFDTLRVMTMRALHGRSPFAADKTHLHHAFIAVGFSHSVTTLTEVMINLAVVGVWGLCVLLRVGLDMQLYAVAGAAMLLVWGTYFFLDCNARRKTRMLHFLTHASIRTHMSYSRWWKPLSSWLDAPEGQLTADEDALLNHHHTRFSYLSPEEADEASEQAVLEFVQGRAEVYVEEVVAHCGVEREMASAAVARLISDGRLTVTRSDAAGLPEIVAL